MARVELPESRLRLRKRRRRVRITSAIGILILLLTCGVVSLTYWPALQIKTVAISGAQTLPPGTIEAFVRDRLAGEYWYVFPKSNIFLYPRQQIAADLIKEYPVLASADVHAADFHTVAVNLVEREPRALLCSQDNRCLFMDENGVAYTDAPTFSEPVYLSYYGSTTHSTGSGQACGTLPKQFLTPPEFQALSALVDAIAQKLPGEKVAAVAVDEAKDVRMRFADNFTLIFTLVDQGGDVFERLTLALTSGPMAARKLGDFQYLDLRFGDKLYYKLRD